MKKFFMFVGIALLSSCDSPPAPQAQGVIEAYEENLAFPLTGRITKLHVEEGQAIAANIEVATVDGDAERQLVAQAEAKLLEAKAALALVVSQARPELIATAEAQLAAAKTTAEKAIIERDRQQQLVKDQVSSQRSLDMAEQTAANAIAAVTIVEENLKQLRAGGDQPAVALAKAQVAVAESAVAAANERLSKTVLYAPPNARVVRHILRRPGELVTAGTPVITVADLARPYVDAFVNQELAAKLHTGDTALVHVDGQPVMNGTIERVGERLEYTPRFLFGPEDRPHLMIRVRVRLPGPAPAAGVPADVTFGQAK